MMEEYLQLALMLQTAIDNVSFENNDCQISFRLSLHFKFIHKDQLHERMQLLLAHAS
jgi:hypothetical protein